MKIAEPDRLVVTLLENAQAKADRASTIALSLLLALGFVWLGHLEPLVPKLQKMIFRDSIVDHAKTELSGGKNKLHDGKGDGPSEQARVEKLRQDLGARRKELEKAAKEASIEFSIPGFPDFEVPREWAGLVWNVLLLGIVAFVARQRKLILTALDDAGKYWREQYPGQELARPTVLMSLPFWVAPLTSKPGDLQNEAWQILTGWRHERSYRLACSCFVLLLCALQVRVCAIATASVAVNPVVHLSSRVPHGLIVTACFLTLGATLLLALDWLLGSPKQKRRFIPERRKLLSSLAVIFVLGSAAAGLFTRRQPETMIAWLKTPRYRRRPKAPRVATELDPGFYLNPRSNVVHYVCPLGRVDAAAAWDDQRRQLAKAAEAMQKAERENTPRPKLALSRPSSRPYVLAGVRAGERRRPETRKFVREELSSLMESVNGKSRLGELRSFWIEDAATDLRVQGKVTEACALLGAALAAPKPERAAQGDVRLGYLLAKMLIATDNEAGLQQLVSAVADRPEFCPAVAAWTNRNGRWLKQVLRRKKIGAVF